MTEPIAVEPVTPAPVVSPVAAPVYDDPPNKAPKDKIWDFVYYNWHVILIIGLCIGTIALYQLLESTKAEVMKAQNTLAVAKQVEAIDSKLDVITKREQDLYPRLEAKIADLEEARKQFKAAEASLKVPSQGAIQDDVNKLSKAEINSLFNTYGYSTSISECK